MIIEFIVFCIAIVVVAGLCYFMGYTFGFDDGLKFESMEDWIGMEEKTLIKIVKRGKDSYILARSRKDAES